MLVKSEKQVFFPMQVYEDLVTAKLATKSVNEARGLVTFKYAKKVMFDKLWNSHPALMECRGITFDCRSGDLIALPVRKSFNYGENGWWDDVPKNSKVVMYKKYNGFMACLSSAKDGSPVHSTTGSTKSDFVKIIEDSFEMEHDTWLGSDLYEIVDQYDPHIINEKIGKYYLGWRCNRFGEFHPNGKQIHTTLSEAIEIANSDQGEGFMVYLLEDSFCLSPCKLKTPYYIGKKRLMRMGGKEILAMYTGQTPARLGPWEDIVPYIRSSIPVDTWSSFKDQTRRAIIEQIWNDLKG